jgi:hypothetical protein
MTKKLNVFVMKMPSNYGVYIEEVDGYMITRKTLNQIIISDRIYHRTSLNYTVTRPKSRDFF